MMKVMANSIVHDAYSILVFCRVLARLQTPVSLSFHHNHLCGDKTPEQSSPTQGTRISSQNAWIKPYGMNSDTDSFMPVQMV